jgi:hypothetical protein
MSYRSPVRTARLLPLVLGVLGACVTQDTGYGGGGYGGDPGGGDPGGGYSPGSNYGGGGGYGGAYCSQDSDCNAGSGSGSNVCARNEECLPASSIWTVHVTWTVSGQPASAATCTSAPDLQLMFGDANDPYDFGFAPVPCAEGEFTIDKMPTYYTQVSLQQNMADSGGATGTFDGSGNSALDLPY